MADGGKKKFDASSDRRALWILNRLGAVFSVPITKSDRFKEAFAQDQNSSKALERFLNQVETPACFFHPTASGESCVASTKDVPVPGQMKKKIVVAVRVPPEAEIEEASIRSNVFLLELSGGIMEILNSYCHSVYLSVLMNPNNRRGWSELVSKDLMDKYQGFLAHLHVTCGLMRGQTLLPLPPREANSSEPAGASHMLAGAGGVVQGASGSKDRVHMLEGAVITWTKQVRYVLKQEPENVFKGGRNPEPVAELTFWNSRADNLNGIHSQLQMDGVRRVLKFLEVQKSIYVAPFTRLQKEVEEARDEANENVKFLRTLEKPFKDLMNPAADFPTLDGMFDGIFHVIVLIWKYSKFYNTVARLAVLIRQICNSVIVQAQNYIGQNAIFEMISNGDVAECYDMIETVIHVCSQLEESYRVHAALAEAQGGSGWKMKSSVIFSRLDAFRERCADNLDFTRIVMQYNKLERVSIGGTKGNLLSMCVEKIREEFEEAVATFRQVKYDIMDVSEVAFAEDFSAFRLAIKDLDQRLASLLFAGFDDLDTSQGRIKLFDAFEGLLERRVIQAELERKQQVLLEQYRSDLAAVRTTFQQHRSGVDSFGPQAPIFSNLPPVAGAIYWVRSLKQRVEDPKKKIDYYRGLLREDPESYHEVEDLYKKVLTLLDEYETERFAEWGREAVDAAKQRLLMRILRRHEKSGLLKVNFDPALVRLLREVRFFELIGLKAPPAALDMFTKADTYRKWAGQLDHVVELYNEVLTGLLSVEEPLLEDRIRKMDDAVARGLTELKWKNEDQIPAFIDNATRVVTDVHLVMEMLKGNMRKISNILSSWCQDSMLERKRGMKPNSIEEFDLGHKERVGRRMQLMVDSGKEIHRYLKDSSEALKISKSSATWKAYVDFVNNIIIEGFVSTIAVSLQYLCEILDPLIISRHEMMPLFDVKIELAGDEIVFDPPFSDEGETGRPTLRSTIDGWLKDFFAMATVMSGRLDTQAGDYLNEIKEHFQMQCLLALVSELIDNTELKCQEYLKSFNRHADLWRGSLDKAFEAFLSKDPRELVEVVSEEGMGFRKIMGRVDVDIGQPIPSLQAFDQEITKYEEMKRELSEYKLYTDIHWLRVRASPVKVTLVDYASQWEKKFTNFLRTFCEDRIGSVVKFIKMVKGGLGTPSAAENPEDQRLLYKTMTHIRDVKLAKSAMESLFQPLRDQVQLLKRHQIVIEDQRLAELEQAPAHWQEVIRAAFNEKEKILPLQREEMQNIRKQMEGFREDVGEFRTEFLEHCPFGSYSAISGDYDRSYDLINLYYKRTCEICDRADKFNDLELLFDMAMSNYQQLEECKEDLRLLKNLWDMIVLVRETFSGWYKYLWDKIDTEAMMNTVKDLSGQVKSVPKGCRSWTLYSWLMDEVKNMQTALPLVNSLHSETMHDRHWNQLMTVTKKQFDKGPDFCFKHLLDLELHHCADDVGEIVDQSQRESKIEKKLSAIRKTWSETKISFDVSREDKTPLLTDLEEVMEKLDADSMEMNSMSSQGRFIEFCKPVVDEWSEKLRTVDVMLQIWRKFQTNWCRLEPIFMQSDDIRSQLPDDSKRFELLDASWKDLMREVAEARDHNFAPSPLVDICCAEGREQTLREISDFIEACERSLDEYLQQKKKAFPRFYFCSNQALLDILSNGNLPLKVAEYLGDVFDGVKTLDFVEGTKGRKARGHIAKDGEVVRWQEPLTLEGPVETYLTNLEAHLRHMLREITEVARTTADNWEMELSKKREEWLEDYPAQLALLASQIQWTEETTRAFEDMESGSETAMKQYKNINDDRIEKLIKRVQGDLEKGLRNKIITIITIDVHARDQIELYVQSKIMDSTDFKWMSQLRFYWQKIPEGAHLVSVTPEGQKTCAIKICDWVTLYLYEYVGNTGRLVITPLTDRCYITLTQALNLILGGAPAGPAGTGKTETTKDLARALGLPMVVYNCSDQMTYHSMAEIFMGLAQVGAWGCFDEFNRISIEVLSVVSTQYKTILDAIRANAKNFLFMEEDIRLIRTVGAFITMNPGYAGRTELPENLKALFRSVAMIVPDLRFICENMLMSEGFIIARPLAHKFVTLYSLCRELLSKQMHYDWGLRAVKSLLRQAGTLKRKEPAADENIVLCRALRDFNVPKITTQDMPIFLRLIQDLFPGTNPEPFQDVKFEKICAGVIRQRKLQADHGFIQKVAGLLDILHVRHCCFIIGPTGCGKTECWMSLMKAVQEIGQDGMWEQVNPKAITSDELYGTMSKSKEWKDGAIAVIIRNMSKEINGYKSSHLHKWLVLDGDIDATWIESMNTVMDDNKVLTLVSNERIPFTPTMRMLLEIQDMKHASPATVSRGGVLFINEADVGWKPYVESWREQMDQVQQSSFYLLFANYFESNLETMRKFSFSCPIHDIGFVQSITCILDALLKDNSKENMEAMKQLTVDEQKQVYEAFFTYAMVWAIGGAVADDKVENQRKKFSAYMRACARGIKMPDQGEVFDYRFEVASKEWVSWEKYVVEYNPVSERMYQNIVISNVELERTKYVIDLHTRRQKPALLVGVAGTGKTTIMKDYLAEVKLDRDTTEGINSAAINLNSYTTSEAFQAILMGSLDKRTGTIYGPPGQKKCIFFVDDLNMPYVDTYDTQAAIMLLTQIVTYKQVYDRAHLDEKRNLVDILFTACMNPKAGSFMINARLQRHFTVLTAHSPSTANISGIYNKILGRHLEGFETSIRKFTEQIVAATGDILTAIQNQPCFLPSGEKFHYQFNLKDISNLFQGLLNTESAMFKKGLQDFLRAWAHEAHRVFCDRLVSPEDQAEMQTIMEKVASKHFMGAVQVKEIFEQPLVMTSFESDAKGLNRHYLPAKSMQGLKQVVEEKLNKYNEENPAMNLVLFDDAVLHVCRICRITANPCGGALLVGVGGSGKQSLARLASFINEQAVLTILVNHTYGLAELKADFQEFYKKAAVKPREPHAFLMTDSQIVDERFLVYINDMLSSGNIPDLFAREEYDDIFNQVRNAAKYQGYADDRDSLFQYFLDMVRRNLHLILCHSPVGSSFRIRGRKFPALISCMSLDVFQPWPLDALEGVAARFLETLQSNGNIESPDLLTQVGSHMAAVHLSVEQTNKRYLEEERRYNSTTPKSFLELISFYLSMLTMKQKGVKTDMERLTAGLEIMREVQLKVTDLREDLQNTQLQVEGKKEATEDLIKQVTAAKADAAKEQAAARLEEEKCAPLAAEAAQIEDQATRELDEAMPAMKAAEEAVDCLKQKEIQELKSMQKPPVECTDVCAACGFLVKGAKKKFDWRESVRMMNNPPQFLKEVKEMDAKNIPDHVLTSVRPLLQKEYFSFDGMATKSTACAYLAKWVVNIVNFNSIYTRVAPLRARAEEAQAKKEAAEGELRQVQKRVADEEAKCAELDQKFQDAEAEKKAVEQQAVRCQEKLSLAERLVSGLAEEKERWTKVVGGLADLQVKLIGNCLLGSAFVGYISPFTATFREDLWKNTWTKDLDMRKIPMTDQIDPMLDVLATEADIAGWLNEGLPADRVSQENASVLTSCSRWPLIIDPQQQGVRWIKQRIGEDLVVITLTQSKWMEKVVLCIRQGGQLLIEAVGNELDAALEPVLSRAVIKRGALGMYLKLGSEEIEYDAKFQLYLQSKLPNPHYRPEVAAQCTIINFTVTPKGLEEQILATVVNTEKPELEQEKQVLVRQQNEFKMELARLEDALLSELSEADPTTILDNVPLIESLEKTKATSKEIALQVQNAQQTEADINSSRELYRSVAAEGSMLFFLVNQLSIIEHMYQYSLDSFMGFLDKAIDRTAKSEDLQLRSELLIASIRITIFRWVSRGLFESHKLIFCAMLTFRLLQLGQLGEEVFNESYLHFLLRGPAAISFEFPLSDWLPNHSWCMVLKLTELDDFSMFAQNLEKDAPNRFKEWFDDLAPEEAKLPLDWKRLDTEYFKKLLVIRCMRPDRMASALSSWIRKTLPSGKDYMDCDASLSFIEVLTSAYEDSTAVTPFFFILSPGADPVKEVEALGRKVIQLQPNVNYHNVAMGQGQDVVAMNKLDLGHKEGHWVMLQNVHLMPRWCSELEKRLDQFAAETSHSMFRLFLSADPSPGIPIGVLERSIKLTNEPPQGLLANLRRSFALFSKEEFEERDSKIKAILFGLCHFHSLMLERKKFGPLGYNMTYPFSSGDLRDSASVLYNYLEGSAAVKLPWEDLRYLVGEIMYGGHIVDDWDRRMCRTYLLYFMHDELLDEKEMIPYTEKLSWKTPGPSPHEKYVEHIESMPAESPLFFGMNPNAEVNFRIAQCNRLFELLELVQPRGAGGGGGTSQAAGGRSAMGMAEDKCSEVLDEVKDIRDILNTEEASRALSDEDKGPYQFVFLQECECMVVLVNEMVRGLGELQQGFKGELTMSEQMEQLAEALWKEVLPHWWVKLGFPSTRPLRSWLVNLKERVEQLEAWIGDPLALPKVVDISKLFNPQSYLTAIKQVCCQHEHLELDKLKVYTEVTKRDTKTVEGAPREGAYVTGLYLEGARWDIPLSTLDDSKPKEMFMKMPIIVCKAGLVDKEGDAKNVYMCPCYAVPTRKGHYVFEAQLRTKQPPQKWVLAGVALILDIGYNI